MFTINIKGRQNPKDLQSVKLEMVFFQTNYARVSKVLNITGPYKEWDNQSQSFKSKNSNSLAKNKLLYELKMRYQQVGEQWELEGRKWSPVELSHHFDTKKEVKSDTKVMSVSQMIDFLTDKFNKRERIKNGQIFDSSNNAKKYIRIKKSLSIFTKEVYGKALSTYFFQDISEQFLLDYTMHLKKMGIANGNKAGLTSKLRMLRAICSHAKKLEMPNVNMEAFECLGDNIKWGETTSKAVSRKDICKIENIDRTLFSKIEQFHLDLFLFSFYCGGMANVDVCNLTWDSIQGNRIIYERMKFPKTAKPLLLDKAKNILEKYKGKGYGNYVFPIFSHKHTSTAKKTTRVKQISSLLNETLTKACKILRIKENITWYSARGSFISMMVDEGYSAPVVAEMAGNSPMVIFRHYYKNTQETELLKRMNERV